MRTRFVSVSVSFFFLADGGYSDGLWDRASRRSEVIRLKTATVDRLGEAVKATHVLCYLHRWLYKWQMISLSGSQANYTSFSLLFSGVI